MAPGRFGIFLKLVIFIIISRRDVFNISREIAKRIHWWLVNIGSGIGLVPSGNKPLPEINVDPDRFHIIESLGHHEFMKLKFITHNPWLWQLTLSQISTERNINQNY